MRLAAVAMMVVALPVVALAQQQQAGDAAMDALLNRLQTSLQVYRNDIPRLYCNESVLSRYVGSRGAETKTAVEAVFRLDRRDPPEKDPRLNLLEDHQVKTVNKVPVRAESLLTSAAPMVIEGVFSNAVSVVSREMAPCYEYKVHAAERVGSRMAIKVDYRFRREMAQEKACHPPMSSGIALFDAETLHPLRVEMSIPHYTPYPGASTYSMWRWRIEFMPVMFDGREYWLPSQLNSRLDSEGNETRWYYEARYTDYHRLTVKSRILP